MEIDLKRCAEAAARAALVEALKPSVPKRRRRRRFRPLRFLLVTAGLGAGVRWALSRGAGEAIATIIREALPADGTLGGLQSEGQQARTSGN